jgi:Spy/CpxP family protein refolding chaperone
MKASRQSIPTLIAAVALTAFAGAAQAFPPGAGPGFGGGPCAAIGPGPGAGQGRGYGPGPAAGNPAAFVEGRMNQVKAALDIKPEQQAAWDAFVTKAKERASTSLAMRNAMHTATPQTAEEHLALRANFARQRAANMEGMSAALKDLYAVLTPNQKAIADQQLARGGMGRGAGQGPGAGRGGYGPGQGGYGPGAGRGYGPRW